MLARSRNYQSWKERSWQERGLFMQAVFLLPAINFLLSLFSFRNVHSLLLRYSSGRSEIVPEQEASELTLTVARMVEAAARKGPHDATCLRRSLVLWWLLRRQGIESDLRIGVKRDNQDFAAHAWVVRQGIVLNDSEEIVAQFTPFF